MSRAQVALAALALGLAGCGADGDAAAVFETRIAGIATQAGLDVPAWQACRLDPAVLARVTADARLGRSAGVGSTPSFLVNGRPVVPVLPQATFQAGFQAAIDAALLQAQASGLPAADYYATTFPELPVGTSPVYGPSDAWVTIVEFSDFECPWCAWARATLDELFLVNGANVRLVYKHFPLTQHTWAGPVAIAAECAKDQGRFWQFHDRVFAGQSALFGGI